MSAKVFANAHQREKEREKEPKKERITLRAGQIPSDQSFELILPANQYEVDYSLTWVKSGGEKETRKGKDDVGLIFVDEMGGN